jgi:hypothetical protein
MPLTAVVPARAAAIAILQERHQRPAREDIRRRAQNHV